MTPAWPFLASAEPRANLFWAFSGLETLVEWFWLFTVKAAICFLLLITGYSLSLFGLQTALHLARDAHVKNQQAGELMTVGVQHGPNTVPRETFNLLSIISLKCFQERVSQASLKDALGSGLLVSEQWSCSVLHEILSKTVPCFTFRTKDLIFQLSCELDTWFGYWCCAFHIFLMCLWPRRSSLGLKENG